MIYESIDISVKGSSKKGEKPDLTTYIIDPIDGVKFAERPMILICPGGGYNHLSKREDELLAFQFNAMGYHAAVLHYSVGTSVYPTQLLELARAMVIIREKTKDWHIDPKKIFVQGSSAGGHLAACLGCFWNTDWLLDMLRDELRNGISDELIVADITNEQIKPDGMILNYPVITSGEYAHRGSFDMLLGKGMGAKWPEEYEKGILESLSLEKQVSQDTPPTFIWHTYEDKTVPVENSLFFVMALKKHNIPVEFHLYPKGGHGLGLGNKLTDTGKEYMPAVNTWVSMVQTFIEAM